MTRYASKPFGCTLLLQRLNDRSTGDNTVDNGCWIYTVKVTVCDRPIVLQPLSVLISVHGVAFMINGYEFKFYQKYLHYSGSLSNMLFVVIIHETKPFDSTCRKRID